MSESSIRTAQAEEQAKLLEQITAWRSDADTIAALCAGAAALRARTDAWQAISTAPKDGTKVLVVASRYGVTYYGYCGWQEFADGSSGWIGGSFATAPEGCFSAFLQPTHWMPLPSPPTPPQEGSK